MKEVVVVVPMWEQATWLNPYDQFLTLDDYDPDA